MVYDEQMALDPNPMPIGPAILTLLHKRRRQAFVCYSSNARGRAAVLISAIRHRDQRKARSHLRDLPEGGVRDFALLASHIGLEAKDADAKVEMLQKRLENKGFTLFGGTRSAMPKVWLNGRRMSIVEAMEAVKCKENYQTIYRRIQRGWPVQEALGLRDRT